MESFQEFTRWRRLITTLTQLGWNSDRAAEIAQDTIEAEQFAGLPADDEVDLASLGPSTIERPDGWFDLIGGRTFRTR